MPATTTRTPSVLAIARSAQDATVVSWLASLFPGTGSGVVAVTVAWLVMTAATVVATTTVIVATLPAGMTPSGHVTMPAACEQLPWLGVADTKVVKPGSASVTSTPAASLGPLFVTVIV